MIFVFVPIDLSGCISLQPHFQIVPASVASSNTDQILTYLLLLEHCDMMWSLYIYIYIFLRQYGVNLTFDHMLGSLTVFTIILLQCSRFTLVSNL